MALHFIEREARTVLPSLSVESDNRIRIPPLPSMPEGGDAAGMISLSAAVRGPSTQTFWVIPGMILMGVSPTRTKPSGAGMMANPHMYKPILGAGADIFVSLRREAVQRGTSGYADTICKHYNTHRGPGSELIFLRFPLGTRGTMCSVPRKFRKFLDTLVSLACSGRVLYIHGDHRLGDIRLRLVASFMFRAFYNTPLESAHTRARWYQAAVGGNARNRLTESQHRLYTVLMDREDTHPCNFKVVIDESLGLNQRLAARSAFAISAARQSKSRGSLKCMEGEERPQGKEHLTGKRASNRSGNKYHLPRPKSCGGVYGSQHASGGRPVKLASNNAYVLPTRLLIPHAFSTPEAVQETVVMASKRKTTVRRNKSMKALSASPYNQSDKGSKLLKSR